MARKKKHEGHVNHERWLVSWADFMTLLFALFTSLYAISTADPKKAGAMAESARAAFKIDVMSQPKPSRAGGSSNKSGETAPKMAADDAPMTDEGQKPKMLDPTASKEAKALQATLARLQSLVSTLPLHANITVKQTKNSIIISLKDKAFFDRGSAKLLPPALPVLDKLATLLLESGMYLRVEGHTDDRPTHSHHFVSNWDLSAARAVSVVQYFADEYAYPPETMAVAGYASGRPVVANDTEEGRQTNRRVDIVLLAAPEGQGLRGAGIPHQLPPGGFPKAHDKPSEHQGRNGHDAGHKKGPRTP